MTLLLKENEKNNTVHIFQISICSASLVEALTPACNTWVLKELPIPDATKSLQ